MKTLTIKQNYGYMLRTPEMIKNGTEQVFLKLVSKVITTGVRKYSDKFFNKDDVWYEVPVVPHGSEYIGMYTGECTIK